MADLSNSERTRLASICGMLTSSHVGERAAAALKASEFLQSRGLTWREALEQAEARIVYLPMPAHPQPEPPPSSKLHETIAQLLQCPDQLTKWEHGFLVSLRTRRRITPKQAAILARLVDRMNAEAKR